MVALSYFGGKLRPAQPQLYSLPGPLSLELVAELAERSRRHKSDPRRDAQHRRALILKNQHEALIQERVNFLQKTEVGELINEHVSTTLNPAEDLVKKVCVVWKRGVVRRLATKETKPQQAFLKLTSETKIASIAPELNRIAYFVGPTIVLPKMCHERMSMEVLPPHCTDVVLDPYDPLGNPVAVAFTVGAGGLGTGADLCTVDTWARRYWRIQDGRRKLAEPEEIEELRQEHDLKRFPGSVLRFDVPLDPDDWWNAFAHKRLEHGSIDVGRIGAHGDYIRRVMNRMLLILAGDLSLLAKNQNLADPEKPVLINLNGDADAASAFKVDVKDFAVDPRHFQGEIRFKVESMAESTGVPVTVTSTGDSTFQVSYDQEALTETRAEQIPHAREFETDFWAGACDYARAVRHPFWEELPTRDEVKEILQLEFSRIARKSSDPKEERDWWDWAMSKGLMSVLDVLREMHPNHDDKQLRDILNNNIKENEVFWAAVAARNAAVNPETMAIQNAAQVNGSLGTPVREANRAQRKQDDAA